MRRHRLIGKTFNFLLSEIIDALNNKPFRHEIASNFVDPKAVKQTLSVNLKQNKFFQSAKTPEHCHKLRKVKSYIW